MEEEIQAFFQEYGQAFQKHYPEKVVSSFLVPTTYSSPDSIIIFEHIDELRENIEAIVRDHQEKGYGAVRFQIENLTPLGDKIANVVIRWEIASKQGELIKFPVFYQLIRKEKGWRISVITNL